MRSLVFVCLFGILAWTPAEAASITFTFDGVVTGVTNPTGLPGFAGIGAGTSFVLSYTFDPGAQDLLPLDPRRGTYVSTGPEYGMSVTFANGVSRELDGVTTETLDGFGTPALDAYAALRTVTTVLNPATGERETTGLQLFGSAPLTTFASDAQLLAPPHFPLAVSFLYERVPPPGGAIRRVLINGLIAEPWNGTVTVVPEPGTLILLGAGSAGLLASARRRRGGRPL